MAKTIDYEPLVAFLNEASLFEIYRLSVALRNELKSPARIAEARQKFQVGDTISYYDEASNSLHKAKVLEKNRITVAILDLEDGVQWKIPYSLLQLDSRSFNFSSTSGKLDRNTLSVGDRVGFNRDGEIIQGNVERLNQKTVSVRTETGERWRVSYTLLHAIIEGRQGDSLLIEKP